MLKLSPQILDQAENYLNTHCRPLEQARFQFLFRAGSPEKVLAELQKFQNPDGGFGLSLEPDFLLPDSSPLATSLAFQFFLDLPDDPDFPDSPDKILVKNAIHYLENSFDQNRHGWFAVPESVNNFPHAPWWNFDLVEKQAPIDACWGNPTAELLGYLYKYKKFVTQLDVDNLITNAINYWNSLTEFTSEHEAYCFIRLYKQLPSSLATKLEHNLILATQKLVSFDSQKWLTYTPQPLHFADNPDFFLFDTVKDGIESNLEFLVSGCDQDGIWSPNWTWGQYESDWEKSRINWQGILTIQNLKLLRSFGRL